MPSSSEGPTCCICLEIYDQELARAFTASCGHSICAQCEFKLRIACMKKDISPQCWICMKPYEGPLYRTYALESATPRTEEARFLNPYMTNSQIRQQMALNPDIYKDIHLPNYTPPGPDLPEPLPRQQSPSMAHQLQQPPPTHSSVPLMVPRPLLRAPFSDPTYPPTYSGYYPNTNTNTNINNNSNRHHPYRPMTTPTTPNHHRLSLMMPCYPTSQQTYPPNSLRCPPSQYQQQQPPPSYLAYIDTINSISLPSSTSIIPPSLTGGGYSQFIQNQIWQQQQPSTQSNNINNYGNYPQM